MDIKQHGLEHNKERKRKMDKAYFLAKVLKITNQDLLHKLCETLLITVFKKRDLVVRRGQFESNLFFLVDGILRGFSESPKGKEATECFIFRPGQPAVGSYRLDNLPSFSIIAETETVCMKVKKDKIQELLVEYRELLHVYNKLLIIEIEEHQSIKHAMYMFDAKERYQWFLDTYDGLIDRVSHKHIASFLNITPVTLSRLRRAGKSN